MSKPKKSKVNLEDFLEKLEAKEQTLFRELVTQAEEGKTEESVLRERFFALAGPAVSRMELAHPGPLWGQFKARYRPKRGEGSHLPLTDLADQLPYPLGMKLRDILLSRQRRGEGEREPQFAFELCALMGIMVRMAALILIRLFVDSGRQNAELNRLIVERLRAPSDGGWLEITQRLSRLLSGEKAPLAVALLAALGARIRLPAPEDADRVRSRDQPGQALQALVKFRNDLVHGDLPDEEGLAEAFALLEVSVRGFAFLIQYRLLARQGEKVWAIEGMLPRPVGDDLNGSLPEAEPCLVPREGEEQPFSLSPLVRFRPGDEHEEAEAGVDELFFLNAGSAERLSYIGYRSATQVDGKTLGSYEQFKAFIAKIPTPPILPDPRIDYRDLAGFHNRLFVGRTDVLQEIGRQVEQSQGHYVTMTALAGMGKSAILANLYTRHTHPPGEIVQEGHRWAFHFCSAIGGRNSATVALHSLIAQLCDAFGFNRRDWLSDDLDNLKNEKFPHLLASASRKLGQGERLILVIDALDEGIGVEKVSIPGFLPRFLPEGVVVLISWRVAEDGVNSRVDAELNHLPGAMVRALETANPLTGLVRGDVDLFLEKLAATAHAIPATGDGADAAWRAAVADAPRESPTADPFYLRLLADGVQGGAIRLDRPETIPPSLDEAFEEMWMGLPMDHDFLAHRLLLYLAIMRDFGRDELFAEVLNHRRPQAGNRLVPDEVAAVRVRIGKLLVYDGERYGLFHDRFGRFLVGEQEDPLEGVD